MGMNPIMKCGHAANATNTATGKPSCAICVGLDPGAEVVDLNPPSLEGRKARCTYYSLVPTGRNHESTSCRRGDKCLCEVPSNPNLPFFASKPNKEHDQFYCGCWGWD